MGEYRSDPAVYAGYARARYDAGVRLLVAHVATSAGACLACAEPAPCAATLAGERWCREFAEWAPRLTADDPDLIRRYVLVARRGRDAWS